MLKWQVIDQLQPLLNLRFGLYGDWMLLTKRNECRLLHNLQVIQQVRKHDTENCVVQLEFQNYELCSTELIKYRKTSYLKE